MKKITLIIIFTLFSIVLSNSIAQSNSCFKLDDDQFASKSKKKYDLEIKYKKGMKFERTFKIKIDAYESKSDDDSGLQFDTACESKNFLKTNITVLDVENDMPSELKIFFKKMMYVKNARSRHQEETKEAEKIVGHWIKIKKYDSKNFKITEKSENFPEIDTDLIDIDEFSKYSFYDLNNFKDKEITEGESFVFDYDCFILDEPYIEFIDELFKEGKKSRELKLKLEKIEKDGKSKIAYLNGRVSKSFTLEDDAYSVKLIVELKIEIDITKHRCRKTCFETIFDINLSPMYEGVYSDNMKLKMQIDNDFSKDKQKDEVDK